MAEARFLTEEPSAFVEVTASALPRLLYVGDVPVEASYHGSALLYRLMQDYPPSRLAIVEAGIEVSQVLRRLPGVSYHDARLPLTRLQRSRLVSWYEAACLRSATWRAGGMMRMARNFKPDAILTVTHGYPWITAAEIADRLDIPLHLICHDEWAHLGTARDWKDRVFAKYYRAAVSRLCVSPSMVESYKRRYGVAGDVLYPSRAADATRYAEPPARLVKNPAVFTCAFAGTISAPGTARALRSLAAALSHRGSRLLIYGPLTPREASANGLDAENIELRGLLPSSDLMIVLREQADTLFVPMSFDAADRANMEICFPSKLTDYTAIGLPLLIYGPRYSSAVRWANDNRRVAEVVDEESGDALATAIDRLADDPERRIALARNSLTVGDAFFSHHVARSIFFSALGRSRIFRQRA